MTEVDNLPDVVPPRGWQLVRLLAIGGTALVYELAGTEPAVLKWARWRDRDIRARFQIEAEVLRAVGPPATPSLVDHGTVDDWPYLIVEHVSAETLATWMSRTGERGGLGEIIAILTRIAGVLGTLHDAGYVHRDLKPENVCIGPKGARLLDFGLAKHLRSATGDLTQVGAVLGTPHYIAPEQIRMGGAVDHRADIYSFGVIAFEMLAGRPPFIGERRAIEYQHQVARPPSVRETRTIPQEIDDIVLGCLAKQPDARPQSAAELRSALAAALGSLSTIRGVGGVTPTPQRIGNQSEVALAWIIGGDPVTVTRAVNEVHGVVVRHRGDGILAGFTAAHHDAPLAVAFGVCRDLVRQRCRAVVHASTALVRRTAQGKPMIYGQEIERVDTWTPTAPFVGLIATRAVAERAHGAFVPATDVPAFFREGEGASGNTTDCETEPTLVGRAALVERIASGAARSSRVIGISGSRGSGKTRLLHAIADKLRSAQNEVIAVRARPRFAGDVPDDARVLHALGGTADAGQSLAAAAVRRAIVIIDDVDRLSSQLLERLLQPMPLARIFTSTLPLFEVLDRVDDQLAIELPALSHADAGLLLREQLRPARLIPEILVERLALRGLGNPRLLLALARDMKRRGAVRRHPGSEEWYVAADELDTLLAAPGPSWLAVRTLDDMPSEVASVLRVCAGLGPRFCADEIARAVGVADATERLTFLLREGLLDERSGWYEFENTELQEAIYDHLLDDRDLVHARALAYWLEHRNANNLGWLARVAYHATGANERATAAACWLALSRAAHDRAEHDHAALLYARAAALLALDVPPVVRDALAALDDG